VSDAVELREDEPNIEVPSTGLSVDAIASVVAHLLHIGNRKVIAGNVVTEGSSYRLLFSINGRLIEEPIVDSNPDALIHQAVLATLRSVEPFIAAAALAQTSRERALTEVGNAEAALPPNDPNLTKLYRLQGILQLDLGRYSNALTAYEKDAQLEPWSSYPYNSMGIALEDEKQSSLAEVEYRRAISLNPKYAAAHNNLAGLLAGEPGRLIDAETEARAAVADDPDLAAGHSTLATVLVLRNCCYNEAEHEYLAALKLDPKNPKTHVVYGVLLAKQCRTAEAFEQFAVADRQPGLDPTSKSRAQRLENSLLISSGAGRTNASAGRATRCGPSSIR